MRLIDADALKAWIDCGHLRNPNELCFSELDVVQILDKQPTIEAEPVRHGAWSLDLDGWCFCNECKNTLSLNLERQNLTTAQTAEQRWICTKGGKAVAEKHAEKKESPAKKYLSRIRLYDARIESGLQELSDLEEMVTRITPVLKQDVVSSSSSQDKLGDTVAKIADLREKINRDVDAFVDLKEEALVKLRKVEKPEYYRLLVWRYVKYYTFERIATEMNYSYRNITKMHGRALQAFEKVMDKA